MQSRNQGKVNLRPLMIRVKNAVPSPLFRLRLKKCAIRWKCTYMSSTLLRRSVASSHRYDLLVVVAFEASQRKIPRTGLRVGRVVRHQAVLASSPHNKNRFLRRASLRQTALEAPTDRFHTTSRFRTTIWPARSLNTDRCANSNQTGSLERECSHVQTDDIATDQRLGASQVTPSIPQAEDRAQ
jgi:hypothetical protein